MFAKPDAGEKLVDAPFATAQKHQVFAKRGFLSVCREAFQGKLCHIVALCGRSAFKAHNRKIDYRIFGKKHKFLCLLGGFRIPIKAVGSIHYLPLLTEM